MPINSMEESSFKNNILSSANNYNMEKYHIKKDFLIDQYLNKFNSQEKIAQELGISQWVIHKRLHKFNIPIRKNTWKLGQKKYSVNEDFFTKLTPDLAWVLGWLMSDGFIRKEGKSHRFGLKLSARDINVLKKIKKMIKFNGKILSSKTKHQKSNKLFYENLLLITSPKIVTILEKYDICENKSGSEVFPKKIKNTCNENIIKSFILGVFEGDGSILFDKKRNSLLFQIVGTKELLTGIQNQLVNYVNLNNTKLTQNIKGKNHYALRYRGNLQGLKIFNWLYKDSEYYLDRKYKTYLEMKRRMKR